jgi:hypothetical protein
MGYSDACFAGLTKIARQLVLPGIVPFLAASQLCAEGFEFTCRKLAKDRSDLRQIGVTTPLHFTTRSVSLAKARWL